MPRQKQSNPKALKQQREEVKLLLKDGPTSTKQDSGTGKHSPSGSKGKTKSQSTGDKKPKYKSAMKVKIAEKVKNKRMARALREKKSSDKKAIQLQDKGNNNMQTPTKETDINEKLIEKLSEPAKKDKYDLIKERSARTTKQTQPKENSPKKSPIRPPGHQKVAMFQKGSSSLLQDTGQQIKKMPVEDQVVVTTASQKETEQEAADKQQALEALLHISGVELDSFTQDKKETVLVEPEQKSVDQCFAPADDHLDVVFSKTNSPGQEKNVSSESSNVVRIDETEIGVKYQLKSDSLEEQGLKLTYTAPNAADYDLNPVSYGVYRPNRSKHAIPVGKQDSECSEFDKDKGKRIGKHVCEFCGRRCLKPSVLKKHIRSHTGERPYPCIPCGFSFKTKSNLYKHRKSHAHAIKAGLTPNLEGIKVIEDDENDSEETESEDEMEIDEGIDTINEKEMEERLIEGRPYENPSRVVEEIPNFGKFSKSGIPGQSSMFSGDAPHTPTSIERNPHQLVQDFPMVNTLPSEVRVIQDSNHLSQGKSIPLTELMTMNSMNEYHGLSTKPTISSASLSPIVNKDSENVSSEEKVSAQGEAGCGQVLENLRSKDVAGFRIDMETGRAMPILHTQLSASEQVDGVSEDPEKKMDVKIGKNDVDSAKLMIPLTNFSIVKSGGQFHVQIPVQGILESAIGKESENLLPKIEKSKDSEPLQQAVGQEKLQTSNIERKVKRTRAESENLISDSIEISKSHMQTLPVGGLLKASQSNRASTALGSHISSEAYQRFAGNIQHGQRSRSLSESIMLKKNTSALQFHSRSSQGLLTTAPQFSQVSVVSSQPTHLGGIPGNMLDSNIMRWPQPKAHVVSPRKVSTSSSAIHYSQSITERHDSGFSSGVPAKDLDYSAPHSSTKKPPYRLYPAVSLPHASPSVVIPASAADKPTFLSKSVIPVQSSQTQQHSANSPNYSRYQTLEETQAALRAAQPKLFKRRKYKSEGDTIPSDIHLPKKRGRKPKHEMIATERVPTPTRPMAPLPFLPTLPPVPQSPLIVSTCSASGRIPMLSSLHFTNFHSVNSESVRHSINSPLGSVIHPTTNILSTTNTESSRNANQGGTAPQFSGVSTNVYSNATASMFSGTTPLSSVHSVQYPDRTSTMFSTSLSVRTHDVPSRGQNSNLAQIVKEAKNRPSLSEVNPYHPPDTQIQAPFPGPSSSWTKRHRGISPKTQEYERPRPLMPMPDLVQIPVGEPDDKKTRIKIESSVASDLKQTLVRPGLLKTSDSLSPLRPNLGSRPSRKNLTLDIPSFGSLKHPAVTHAGKCTTPIEYAAKTLLSPEAFSIAQSVVKLASPMKNKPDGTPTTPVEAARELGRLAAHAAFANAGGKVENILSPMIPSMATSQGSIVVGPITTPTTSGPQKQYFVLPSPSKSHNPGFPSQSDNPILKKQKPIITTAESISSVVTPLTVQTPPKPSPVFPPIPAPSHVMSPKVRSQAPSSSIVQQTEFTPVLNKPFQNRSKSASGQTIEFIHGLPTYQAKSRHRTSALDKIDETVVTNEGYKTFPPLLKYLYKNANGNHNITTPMFTCLYRTQPMYVKQHSNYKVSMYSNWRSGSTSLHPLGMSWKAHLGLNDSSRNRRPKMVYIASPLSKDQDGILTHSSMWRREDQCTLASQQNIPSLKKQQHNDSPSRGEVNANFPHKLFRHGRIHHRRTESESAVIDSKSKERKMKDLGKHEPLRVPIFEGGFKSNEEYVYVRGRGRGKYVCEECGIRCKKPSMLKKHIRTHTDMRPYKCSICNFAFKTKGNLTKHMKSKAHNKKTVSTGGDDDDLGNLDDDDDRIEEEDYDNDHQFSDADENEDTDSVEGETSDEDDEDDDTDSRCHDHSFLRRKRSHGSLPDISGFAGSSSDYHFSSILAGSLPSFHATRTDQSLSDSSDGVPARRTLKRSHSESLDKIRREKSEKDVLSDPLKSRHYPLTPQMNYLPGEAGKTEDRKPTRSEVVGKLTQHLTNKNLEKLRAQTQSHPLVTTPNSHSGSSKSFDINQLPLPQMGPGILPLPTFQPTYGLSVMNISTGLAGSRSQEHIHSVPMGSNYRISAKIHEVTKPDNLNTVSLSKSEGTQEATNESVHLALHKNSAQKTITDVAAADSNAFKTHTTTALKSLPVTESNVRGFDPGLVGSVFIPVSSVLQGGLIPPTTAPYSSGQFIFTFPMPSPATTKESDVLLPVQHPKINQDVLRSSPQMKPSKISEHSPVQKKDLSSQDMETKSHGFHTMPSPVTFTKRKRIQDSENISTVLTPPEQTTNESLENIRSVDNAKRIKYINTDVNHALQQPINMNRVVMPKSLHHQMVHAPQAQFIPPPVAPPEVSLISHHSPKFTFSHGSSMSQVPLVSPITPSRMSQLPPTILSTPDINTSVIQHHQLESYSSSDKTSIPPSSLSTEVTKSSDVIHKRIIEVENSDIEGIPSPTATRGGFHKCNVCLQGFIKPSQLRIHMRTHSDEHPYSCEECSLSFRSRGLLQKHERSPIHFSHVEAVELSTENADDPRPFKCKECSIAFRIPGHLAKHLRSKGHIMALERQGKLTRHRHELGDIDGSPTKDDGFGDHEDENTDSASEGEAEKVVVEEVKQVEYVHQMDNSD